MPRAKQNINKTKSKETKQVSLLTDKQMDDISSATGKALNGEAKVQVLIPKVEGESDTVEVSINGYNYVIKKGEMVALPISVVHVLKNAQLV